MTTHRNNTNTTKARAKSGVARSLAALAVGTTCTCAVSVQAAETAGQPVRLEQPGICLQAGADGAVTISNGEGAKLMSLTGMNLKWEPNLQFRSESVRAVTSPDGQPGVEVAYAMESKDAPFTPSLTGTFFVYPRRVEISFDVVDVPTNQVVKWGGCMLARTLGKGIQQQDVKKGTHWERNAYGGVPVEVADGLAMDFRGETDGFFLVCDKDNRPNTAWADGWSQHVAIHKTDSGTYHGTFNLVVAMPGWSADAVAAQSAGRLLTVSLSTPKLYNWWQDADTPLSLDAEIANVSESPRDVAIAYWVRSFDGTFVAHGRRKVTIPSGQTVAEPISFESPNPRDIFFAEVSATDLKTGSEAFRRTNLTLLPPHEFHSTADDSVFGLAAYWPIPTEEDVQNLMDRMGVRWVRSGDTRIQHAGRIANHHSNINWRRDWTSAERDEWIRKQLAMCAEQGNPYWEFANEINMSTLGIAMEGGGIGKAALADEYVDWIKAIRRIQEESESNQVKLLSFGLAGMDTAFVDKIHKLGGWGLLDGLCLHPGRGNFAVDYPVEHPEVQDYESPEWSGPWQYSSYWNFLGSVRTALGRIRKYGEKSLWLTEIYTPTYPNSFWEDTMRNATENVVLTYALIKAEGVKCGMWYQLFDSVWYDRLGVNAEEREYFFGLVQRDLSFKPSVLAYCTIAEALDQATFKGWILFPDSKTHGLLFDTPRGSMAVLWDRTDGYYLTKRSTPFASPEPWVDTWKSRIHATLPATGDVTVINCIGQETVVPARDGQAELTLDGAARIIYGLDASRLKLSPRVE